jgi:hypothetical protein
VIVTSNRIHDKGVNELPKKYQAIAVTADPAVPGAIGALPEKNTVAMMVRRKPSLCRSGAKEIV